MRGGGRGRLRLRGGGPGVVRPLGPTGRGTRVDRERHLGVDRRRDRPGVRPSGQVQRHLVRRHHPAGAARLPRATPPHRGREREPVARRQDVRGPRLHRRGQRRRARDPDLRPPAAARRYRSARDLRGDGPLRRRVQLAQHRHQRTDGVRPRGGEQRRRRGVRRRPPHGGHPGSRESPLRRLFRGPEHRRLSRRRLHARRAVRQLSRAGRTLRGPRDLLPRIHRRARDIGHHRQGEPGRAGERGIPRRRGRPSGVAHGGPPVLLPRGRVGRGLRYGPEHADAGVGRGGTRRPHPRDGVLRRDPVHRPQPVRARRPALPVEPAGRPTDPRRERARESGRGGVFRHRAVGR